MVFIVDDKLETVFREMDFINLNILFRVIRYFNIKLLFGFIWDFEYYFKILVRIFIFYRF